MAENIDLIQRDSNDSAVDSATNGESNGESKIELLSEFLKNECVESSAIGQFQPNNKQLKDLINCIDDSTGELINLS